MAIVASGLEEGHWDVSAGSVHFQFVQESLAGIQSGLIAAMSMTRKHRSLIQSHVCLHLREMVIERNSQAFELLLDVKICEKSSCCLGRLERPWLIPTSWRIML